MKRALGVGAKCGCDEGTCELCCHVPTLLKVKGRKLDATTVVESADVNEEEDDK